MKLITRDTDYAVRAVAYIAARKGTVLSVAELQEALRIPRPFLRKILQALTRTGILGSRKGIGGGFELLKKPSTIRLTDIIEVFQGALTFNECLFKRKLCPNRRTCVLKKKIDAIERHIIHELRSVVMSDLL